MYDTDAQKVDTKSIRFQIFDISKLSFDILYIHHHEKHRDARECRTAVKVMILTCIIPVQNKLDTVYRKFV